MTRRRIERDQDIHESDFDDLLASSSESDYGSESKTDNKGRVKFELAADKQEIENFNSNELDCSNKVSSKKLHRDQLSEKLRSLVDVNKKANLSAFDKDSRRYGRDNVNSNTDGLQDNIDMEITFAPALSSSTETKEDENNFNNELQSSSNDNDVLQKNECHKSDENKKDGLTPFEQFLNKRRLKRRQQKQEMRIKAQERIRDEKLETKKRKREVDNLMKVEKIQKSLDSDEEINYKDDKNEDLKKGLKTKLPGLSAESKKVHFDMELLAKAVKNKDKKKKKGDEARRILEQDNFELDLNDERFQGIFDNHQYAIDPTNSQ